MLHMGYFAGFFDADGSVGVYCDKYKRKARPFDKDRYHLRVNVCNQNKQLLEGFAALWGGGVYRQARAWIWTISATKAVNFLRDILPHVVHKREQVELAVEWQASRSYTYPGRHSDPDYAKFVCNKLKELKRIHRENLVGYPRMP